MKLLNKIAMHFYYRIFFVLLIYPLLLPVIILTFRPDIDFRYYFFGEIATINNSAEIKGKLKSGIQLKLNAVPDPESIYVYQTGLINSNYNIIFRLVDYPDNLICLIQNDEEVKNLILDISYKNDNTSDKIIKILSYHKIDSNDMSKVLNLLDKKLELSGRIYSINDCNYVIKNILNLCDFYNFSTKDLVNLNRYYDSINEKNPDDNIYLLVNGMNPDIDSLVGSSLTTFLFLTFASFIIIFALSYNYIFKYPVLINFIRKSKFKKAMEYIRDYTNDINAADRLGNNALIWAVLMKNYQITYELIERGTDINKRGYKNITPLTAAVINRDYKIIDHLLYKKSSPDTIIDQNFTVMHYAVLKKDLELIRLLLSHQARIDIIDENDQTPFILAVNRKEEEIIKMFLETKPEVLSKIFNGRSIYDIALETNENSIKDLFYKYIKDK